MIYGIYQSLWERIPWIIHYRLDLQKSKNGCLDFCQILFKFIERYFCCIPFIELMNIEDLEIRQSAKFCIFIMRANEFYVLILT